MMLDRDSLLELLGELAAELERRSVRGEMFVVGGAAMALAYSTRRATKDIDAIFEPKALIYELAGRLAEHRGLDRNWLNDAVKGFLPGEDCAATLLFERPGLVVRVASPRYLLAMKVMAARVERDEDDIRRLFEVCAFRTAREGLELVEEVYPHIEVQPKVRYLLEEMFPDDPE
jgi:hypothetical protein